MAKKTHYVDGQLMLLTPRSDWTVPKHLPDLRGIDVGLDTETKDNGLAAGRGAGWALSNGGYVLGVSVAWSGGRVYAPLRHPDTENMDHGRVFEWVEGILRHNRVHFFNAVYDMGWLWAEGCRVWPERMEDGQIMAVMCDENYDSFGLDACCARAGIQGKDKSLLKEAAATYGVAPVKGSIMHGLWRIPARFVGPYAEQDPASTLELCKGLYPTILAERQEAAYRTEIDLLQVTWDMRRKGIPVNESTAERTMVEVQADAAQALAEIEAPPHWHRKVTIDDILSPKMLKEMFDAEGIRYPYTAPTKGHPEGQPSFQKEWLEKLEHPMGKQIRRAKQLQDLGEKFIGTYILQHNDRGRIHAEINQLKGEDGGAITHRFSYANPPLQQMPSKDPVLAPKVRGIFEPEKGQLWAAPDYSQQEPRLYVHFAHLSVALAAKRGIQMLGTEDAIAYYRDKGDEADFHQMMANMTGLIRRVAKDINLGVFYRMGWKEFARQTGLSEEKAEGLFKQYHQQAPWIQGLARFCEYRANAVGYIRMIDGARRHFPLWQPKRSREAGGYLRQAAAAERWAGQTLERAFTYQAGNALIQGSAARQTKTAMVQCYRAGHCPLVQMHDELDFSLDKLSDALEIEEIMRNVVRLVVPIKVDLEFGTNWGNAKSKDWEATMRMAA